MILPNPPYTLSREYKQFSWSRIAFLGVLGLFILLAGTILSLSGARQILEEEDVWRNGEVAAEAVVEGVERGPDAFAMNDYGFNYTFDVKYVAKDGTRHEGHMEFLTLFKRVDRTLKPEVRYRASDPAHFALSWGLQVVSYRWALMGVCALFGLTMGTSFLYLVLKCFREMRLVEACGRGAQEVWLTVVDRTEVERQTFRYRVEGTSPWGGEIVRETCFENVAQAPLFLDAARTQVLGLVSHEEPQRVLVVTDTLYPFEFSAAALERVRERLRIRA
jgi:hypothetical protein